jgi:16S rRNA (cytidine1402-2'-O)-methyltransferase
MWQQKSYEDNKDGGKLYLVPTPIGNLEDMSFRAIRVLKEADLIAAEDTRQTKKLCHYYDIPTPITSYHEHNKDTSGEKILAELRAGRMVALVSDAGMPTISDPGYELVQQALEEKHFVIPLPGPNAALTALTASGLIPQPFYFYGFLARHKKEKRKQLESLKHLQDTIIFYEAPHRLKETLELILEVLGNRKMSICRELTKRFEEFIRGNVEEVIEWAEKEDIRGEFCLIVEGSNEQELSASDQWWKDMSIVEHVNHYIETEKLTPKEAIKKAAKDRDLPKREVYQQFHANG